jgi:hypothetical protein
MSNRVEVPEVYLYSNWRNNENENKQIFIPKYELEGMRKLIFMLMEFITKNQPIIDELNSRDLFQIFDFFKSFKKEFNVNPPTKMKWSQYSNRKQKNHYRTNAFMNISVKNINQLPGSFVNAPNRKVYGHRRVRTTTSLNAIMTNSQFNGSIDKEHKEYKEYKGIDKGVIGVDSINNFLQVCGVEYKRKDILLLVDYFGDFSGELSREKFLRFFRICANDFGN